MEECWLTFPQRREKPAACAERNGAVISDVCYFKADFILVRDEHRRIAVWSKFEDEVAFVVSACAWTCPSGKRSDDSVPNGTLGAVSGGKFSQQFKQLVCCRGAPLWPPLVWIQEGPAT